MDRRGDDMATVLEAMCAGSVEAFDLFYERYAPLVMHIALRVMDDRMEAEDLCHDVFLEVLRTGRRFDRSRGSIESWLAVLTRSRGLDRLRRARRAVPGGADAAIGRIAGLETAASALEDTVVLRFQQAAVREAFAALPSQQRRALATAYYREKTQREMADEWNVPLGTVKSWIRGGIANLRKQLAVRGWLSGGEGGTRHDAK
ncbi:MULTISPECIES: sigma-70 family RNA polymerase sigma factor [Thermobacillus]|uniref:RNA polymerase sigma factor, sigma-70 family n=1 Tax=Thermobacillus composti (strain DSM 18247 / JCM 13945 / KWC4) TaxID=717605 RepID=L0EEM0_THECK|nr:MULTISPECIES: sigma-70 family RNA polymerase sigma factor [Thermobacillus]AGA58069.1 RNA polymerase sigma factor, sigma-70 family [Thermobacillus composti KWC4]